MTTALPEKGRRPAAALLLLLVCGAAFFAGADRPGLLEKDETRYSITAREMVRGGDRLVPHYNGRERLVKPPGATWAVAAAFEATGRMDERTARLPSAIAATLTVLLVAWGAARTLGVATGLAAGIVLATMLQFLVQGRLATTDMLYTLFFTAASAALVPPLVGSPRPVRWILLSGLLAGMAGLVKTPVAILLPPLAAAAAGLLHARLAGPDALPAPLRAGNRARTSLALLGAVAVFAVVFLAWLLPANARTDGRLWRHLAGEATARLDADREVHAGPPWYFLPLLVGGALPWTFLAIAGVGALLRRAREAGRAGVLVLYCGLSVDIVFLFFSVLPSKLPAYVLPAYPFLAVVAALSVADLASGAARPWERKVAGGGAFVLGFVVVMAATLLPGGAVAGLPVPDEARIPAAAFGLLLAAGGGLLLARRTWAAVALHAAAALSLVATSGPLLPRVEEGHCARDIAKALVAAGMRPEDRLYDVTNHITGLLWYADRGSETKPDGTAPEEARVLESFAKGERTWLVVKDDPEGAIRRGRATQWERMRGRLPPGTPQPRVAWRGWERVVVTNVR